MSDHLTPGPVFQSRRTEDLVAAPASAQDRDPVQHLVGLLARSAARDLAVGVGGVLVPSFTIAVGSYRP